MATFHEPTAAEAIALFETIEQKFPSKTLGDGKWYLVAVSNADLLSSPLTLSYSPRPGARLRRGRLILDWTPDFRHGRR